MTVIIIMAAALLQCHSVRTVLVPTASPDMVAASFRCIPDIVSAAGCINNYYTYVRR